MAVCNGTQCALFWLNEWEFHKLFFNLTTTKLGKNNLNYAEFITIKPLIKPQGVKSKIVAPDSYVEDNGNS